MDGIRNGIPSVMPEVMRLRGPSVYVTYGQIEEAEARYSDTVRVVP